MGVGIVLDREAIGRFCEKWKIQELALFGSVLREDFGPESDVDVLVTFSPEAVVSLIEWSRIQRELSVVFGRKVDLVSKRGLKPVIRDSVLETSQIVYAA